MLLLLCCTIARGAELQGTVRGADGDPVPGVSVYAYDARLGYASATTTNAGRFVLTGLPAGRYRLRAVPRADVDLVQRFWPNSWSFCSGEAIEVAEDEVVEGLDFDLSEGAWIEGVVTDLDGAPLQGVSVTCAGAQARVANELYRVSTDADGAFRFVGLDADLDAAAAYELEFELSGWPDQYLGQVYDDDDAELVELRLGEVVDVGARALLDGISVTGQVSGPDGPLEDADVHVYATSQIVSTHTDEEGRYRVDGLPPGDVLSWASLSGYGFTYWPDVDRPGDRVPADEEGLLLEGVDLTLPWEARFQGEFEGGEQDLSGVTVLLWNDTFTVGIGAQADAEGEFTVDRLHGGDYRLFVYAESEGYVNDYVRDEDLEPRWFTVAPEQDSETFEVTLPRAAVFEARLVDETGAPVYGAAVYITPDDERLDTIVGVSDSDGYVEADGVFPGRYRVELRYSVYCEQDPGYVIVWWPGEVDGRLAGALDLEEGERFDAGTLTMPIDADLDGMGDAWERENGLDPTRDDSDEDPDGDGYTNLEEYLLGTDPQITVTEEDCGGCGGDRAALILPLGLLALGRRRRW